MTVMIRVTLRLGRALAGGAGSGKAMAVMWEAIAVCCLQCSCAAPPSEAEEVGGRPFLTIDLQQLKCWNTGCRFRAEIRSSVAVAVNLFDIRQAIGGLEFFDDDGYRWHMSSAFGPNSLMPPESERVEVPGPAGVIIEYPLLNGVVPVRSADGGDAQSLARMPIALWYAREGQLDSNTSRDRFSWVSIGKVGLSHHGDEPE